jgi:hypothetical protein
MLDEGRARYLLLSEAQFDFAHFSSKGLVNLCRSIQQMNILDLISINRRKTYPIILCGEWKILSFLKSNTANKTP